jgi:glycosyltransferase involved in cell wall biosynthesis
MYKWVGIPEVRGLSREQAAERIGKSCLAVWVDDISGFGTFPLECMEAGTPVIGKIPNLVPEWMEKTNEDGSKVIINNGVWTSDLLNIPELIAKYLQAWLEDNEPQEIIDEMKASTGQYTSEKRDTAIETVYAKFVNNRKEELGEIADQFAEAEAKEVEKQAALQNEEK